MESYEEDDLFRDLYGDNEAETGLLRAKKSVDGGENGDSGAAAGIGDRRTGEIPKVGPKLADLSSNIEEKGPEPLSPDKRDIACASWVKNDGSRQKNRERSDLRGESEVLCVKNDDLTESVEQTASEVTGSTIREDGKMFIGGLNWETTDESLREYFEQFGEVTECNVMRDNPKCVNTVMVKEHYLDGKIIDPKRAIPREEQEKTAKMFVGGVSQDCTEEEFKEFFSAFGRVIDATLMIDKDTGKPRGFGFVTFESEAAVENAMAQPYLAIHDKQVEVKRATPKGNLKERMNMTKEKDANGYDYQRNYYGKDNAGFNTPMDFQSMQQFYGGMSPAIVAQYYQRMQAYMAAMQNMGRGMQIPGGMGRAMTPGMPGFLMGMNMGPMNPMMMNQMNNMMGGMVNFNNANFPSQSTPQMTAPTPNQETHQASDDGNMNTNKDTEEKEIVQKANIKTCTTDTTATPSTQPSRPTPPPNAPTGPSKTASSSRNHRMGYSRNGRGHSFHPYQRRNQ
ncbi:hypothetical protein MERGE_001968 [Pneumocystis wakefieldiae]|uniref:RRM domain-containing protein n=1 Tax=Pneumocystis wakefieldiae TaxID=38082 RepID=A0A899FWA8_9ASCO|nr:hypothetical protein MERGE_001968 [Pneumocystis wakefieldiae]